MKKTMSVLVTLSILASSLLFTQPASAIGTLYSPSTGNGDVECTSSGFFTIQNNVVLPPQSCYGTANIPSGVTTIGYRAFFGKQLSAITIPNTVTSIGEQAFAQSNLRSISIPNSVTTIGPFIFYNTNNLTSVSFGNGITEIPDGAFQHAHGLTTVNIPDSVLSIGSGAFWAATSLTSITIPDSVTSIGISAFQQMLALESVVIGNGVTTIENQAFYGLERMRNLVIGNSVRNIGDYAFFGPNLLTSVTLPNSLTRLGGASFSSNDTLLTYKYCGTGVNSSALTYAGLGSKTRLACPAAITAGSEPNSQVATFSSGVTLAEIPASTALPAIKLAFLGSAPSSLIVKPITNPASLSATPFMTTGSPRIVDIEIPGGHDGSDVKICLDGASTDNLYHYTSGHWVELAPRTYENNQVCGYTDSFSPFVAAPVNPVTAPGAPTIGTATATGTTTATISFTAPASDGGSTILSYTATSSPGSITATITQAGSGTISVTGLSAATAYTFTVTATNSAGTSVASSASNSITTFAPGIAPLFSSASSYDGRFTVQIKDYDEAFTYTVTASEGTVSVNATGLITVNGLRPDQSVTVNVTTTRAGYASGTGSITGRAQVAAMLPGTKPTLTITDTLITCTIGSYSATPTSSAFSLFVDGKHVSTIFSSLGEYLPDWIIPWATSNTITRTATLVSASWSNSDAYQGKAITCTTLAYSKNAIGLTSSEKMMVK